MLLLMQNIIKLAKIAKIWPQERRRFLVIFFEPVKAFSGTKLQLRSVPDKTFS